MTYYYPHEIEYKLKGSVSATGPTAEIIEAELKLIALKYNLELETTDLGAVSHQTSTLTVD